MRFIDQEYTAHPFLGSRKLTLGLIAQGEEVNRKRVQRLMQQMEGMVLSKKTEPILSRKTKPLSPTSMAGSQRRARRTPLGTPVKARSQDGPEVVA